MESVPTPVSQRQPTDFADLLCRQGTAAHRYVAPVVDGTKDCFIQKTADLADALHHLAHLHGAVPGLIDHAAQRVASNVARRWIIDAIEGFAVERRYLTMLTVEAGPQPSTNGNDHSTTLIVQQRHAIDMLAQSDRRGTAIGAALALVSDWQAIRTVLDRGAIKLGLDPAKCRLPRRDETLDLAQALIAEGSSGRAILFGAAQLFGQHRALWDLMQSRAEVRASDPY